MSETNKKLIITLYSKNVDHIDSGSLHTLTKELNDQIEKQGVESIKITDSKKDQSGQKVILEGLAATLAIELIPIVVKPLMGLLVEWIKSKQNNVNVTVGIGNEVYQLDSGTSQEEINKSSIDISNRLDSDKVVCRRHALLISNSDYHDTKLKDLNAPEFDAEALKKILTNKEIGIFEKVEVLLDESSRIIRNRIVDFYKDKTSKDLLLLYFSGHGVKHDDNLYLAAQDTSIDYIQAEGIDSNFIIKEMENCPSKRKVIIFDCCFSGAAVMGAKSASDIVGEKMDDSLKYFHHGYGKALLTASNEVQYAWEGEKKIGGEKTDKSLFTHYLIEGLETGKADMNGDGIITINEIHEYVSSKISHTQNPILNAKQEGQIVIARNPNPVVKSVPLPKDLEEALTGIDPFRRLGAIDHLKQILENGTKGEVIAAKERLETISINDDSKAVSGKARKTLEDFNNTKTSTERVDSPIPPTKPDVPISVKVKPEAVKQGKDTIQTDSTAKRSEKNVVVRWDKVFQEISTQPLLPNNLKGTVGSEPWRVQSEPVNNQGNLLEGSSNSDGSPSWYTVLYYIIGAIVAFVFLIMSSVLFF